MKHFSRPRRYAVLATSVLALHAATALAANLVWDINPGDGASRTDGTGTWLNGAGNWNDGATDALWTSATPDSATFGSGGTAGTVTLGGAITAGGLTFEAVTGSYLVTGNQLTLAGTPAITVNDDLATIDAVLAGGAISKGGNGILVLGGANAFTGVLSITAGTVRANHLSALGTNAAGTTVSAGAMLELTAAGTYAGEALALNGTGLGGTGALLVSTTCTWSGAITAATAATINVADGVTLNATNATGLTATGTLTKTGGGTMVLTGGITAGTGGVAVNDGTLFLSNNTVRLDSGNISVGNGGTLRVAGTGTDSIGNTRTVTVMAGGTFDFQQTANETLAGIFLSGSGVNGSGAMVNSAAVTAGILTTPVTLQGNTTIGVADAAGTLTFANAVTGAFGLTKVGAGKLSLANNGNAVTGAVVVDGGILALGATNNSFSGVFGASSLTINNGGTVQIVSSNGLTGNGTAAGNFVPVTVNAGGTLAALPGTSSHIRSLLTLRGGSVTATTPDTSNFGNLNFDGGVVAGGVATTSVVSALGVTNSQAGGTIYNVSPGATNGIDLDITGTLIDAASVNETVLMKTGTGTMRLAGANTYVTQTQVLAGKLLVTGSITTAQSVRVAAGAVFGGTGLAGPLTPNTSLTDAGTIAPGPLTGAGILTAPSAQANTGLDFEFELTLSGSPLYGTATASGNDVLHLTNAASFGGTAMTSANLVRLFFDHAGDTYRGAFYGFDGVVNATTSLQAAVSGATYEFYVRDAAGSLVFGGQNYTALLSTDVNLAYVGETANFTTGTVTGAEMQFTVVPEPAGALLLLGGLAVCSRRRRHSNH